MKLLAPLAVRYGYDVQVFAPGKLTAALSILWIL
jgi:hypothetical protein